MEKILEIKNLKVSFRTNDGTVKAVRDISVDLNKGETLAIVGESGSGKSVTAKAILGILAPNSIVESGEIIYDGKDLLKITEEEFHNYRGNRLSMIFQDPMSSLNPIMRIGKQLTEAMILNGKANQRNARRDFQEKIKLLDLSINRAINIEHDKNSSDNISKYDTVKLFKKQINACIKAERAFNDAYNNILNVKQDIEDLLEDISSEDEKEAREQLKYILTKLNKVYNHYTIQKEANILPKRISALKKEIKKCKDIASSSEIKQLLKEIKIIFEGVISERRPDFFLIYSDKNFMKKFEELSEKGLKYSHYKSLEDKRRAVNILENSLEYFKSENLKKNICFNYVKKMSEAVESSINHLQIKKDSNAYTFKTSIANAVEVYFNSILLNKKELARYEKENKRIKKLLKKKADVHTAAPAMIVDLDAAKNNIVQIISSLVKSYKEQLEDEKACAKTNFKDEAKEMVEYLTKKSSAIVYKVTANMAKNNALRLMKEVGISHPRKRFKQYPFQFSGGMRQRIVIAIALAANPDILICDEPTTALDVTIQAQILELINNLKEERKLSIIFITHDLGVVANMADRIAVMYAGKIVEEGTVDEIFYEPAHPYTWALLASMPDLETKEKLDAIPGTPPNMIYPPIGDAFAARNKYAMQIDFEQEPPMFDITKTHCAATWLMHPKAPKVEPPKIVTDRIERMKRANESFDKNMQVLENAQECAEQNYNDECIDINTEVAENEC